LGCRVYPATLTLLASSEKKCCSVLQYKVKMQGVGAVTKPIVATIITPCIFASITTYENSSDLVLNPNVNAGYNLAKRVRNIVNPDSIKSKRIYV